MSLFILIFVYKTKELPNYLTNLSQIFKWFYAILRLDYFNLEANPPDKLTNCFKVIIKILKRYQTLIRTHTFTL